MRNQEVAKIFSFGFPVASAKNLEIGESRQGKRALKSYGYYCIAIELEKDLIAIRVNKFSQTTACHIGLVVRALQGQGFTPTGEQIKLADTDTGGRGYGQTPDFYLIGRNGASGCGSCQFKLSGLTGNCEPTDCRRFSKPTGYTVQEPSGELVAV